MSSKQYWKKRAELRMYGYHKQADKIADEIAESYISASEYISQETRKIFLTFQNESGLSEKAAREILNSITDKDKLNRLKSVVREIKDPVIRHKMMSILSSPAYAYRIKRFEKLQEEIDRQLSKLADIEFTATRNHYIDTAYDAFNHTMFDIQKGTSFGFHFSSLSITRVAEILDNAWSGKHYSDRIWANSEDLSVKLKQELLTGFLTGRSYQKTAKEIQNQFEVGAFEARRLVRTESTYIANMAEIESYKEAGIRKYQFLATLDIQTSEMCRAMDGKEFGVDDAVPGVNLPPLHPFCRSTTVCVIDKQLMDKFKRRARDPVTGKTYLVPGNMTYNEWYEKYVESDPQAITAVKKFKNKYSDKKQHQKYRAVLEKNVPKSFEKFQDLKYNNTDEWLSLKRKYADYRRFDKVVEETSKLNIKGKPIKDIQRIAITDYTYDSKHINNNRGHNVTKQDAQSYINKSKVAYSRWDGDVIVYVSEDGATVVNLRDKIVSTAYKSEEYDNKFKKLMEELK